MCPVRVGIHPSVEAIGESIRARRCAPGFDGSARWDASLGAIRPGCGDECCGGRVDWPHLVASD